MQEVSPALQAPHYVSSYEGFPHTLCFIHIGQTRNLPQPQTDHSLPPRWTRDVHKRHVVNTPCRSCSTLSRATRSFVASFSASFAGLDFSAATLAATRARSAATRSAALYMRPFFTAARPATNVFLPATRWSCERRTTAAAAAYAASATPYEGRSI